MKSRLKSFRWTRFLIALVVTFVAVLAVGRAMAAEHTSPPGKSPATATAPSPATTASSGLAGVPEDTKADTTRSYYKQVDAIRTDTELVTAEINNLKAHHELDQARSGIFKSDTTPAAPTGMPMMQMPGSLPAFDTTSSTETRSAVVVQTSMVDGRWVASIRLPSGNYINNARAGQEVRGVGRILSISLDDVTVSRGKQTYSLPFADDGGATGAVASPARAGVTVAPPLGIR